MCCLSSPLVSLPCTRPYFLPFLLFRLARSIEYYSPFLREPCLCFCASRTYQGGSSNERKAEKLQENRGRIGFIFLFRSLARCEDDAPFSRETTELSFSRLGLRARKEVLATIFYVLLFSDEKFLRYSFANRAAFSARCSMRYEDS